MPTVRDAAFAVFEHFGVDRLFGNPGSTELPMLKGMPFPYVMGLNEAVVVGMADGFARSSGKPALVNLHSAAGTGHSLGNLFTAWKNNAPDRRHRRAAGAHRSCPTTRSSTPSGRPNSRGPTSSIRSNRRAPRTCRWR